MKKSILSVLVLSLLAVSLLPTVGLCKCRTSANASAPAAVSVKTHKKHKIGNPAKKLAKGVKRTFTIKHHKKH